jgi:predicted dehydrogenase
LEQGSNHLTRFAEDFADAVLSGSDPPVTGEDGRRALEIVIAAYESGLNGTPIDLPL